MPISLIKVFPCALNLCDSLFAPLLARIRLSSQRGQKKGALWLFSLAILALLASSKAAQADITTVGNVTPSNPGTWTSTNTHGYIGKDSYGSLLVNGGSSISTYASYVGYSSDTTGIATIDGTGSKWRNSNDLEVGFSGTGTLNITGGGYVRTADSHIGNSSGSTGTVMVDGVGSTCVISEYLWIGLAGSGTLDIKNGGTVASGTSSYYKSTAFIGNNNGSIGTVTVDGTGSRWMNDSLIVGRSGQGTLDITRGGLVTVERRLEIDYGGISNDSFINMRSGGMLAIVGDVDDSLTQFLSVVEGTDAIRYWNGSTWDHLNNATVGSDYTLKSYSSSHLISGYDVNGYTVLTVPEPSSAWLASLSLLGLSFIRRRRR